MVGRRPLCGILCEFVNKLIFWDSIMAWGPDNMQGEVAGGTISFVGCGVHGLRVGCQGRWPGCEVGEREGVLLEQMGSEETNNFGFVDSVEEL